MEYVWPDRGRGLGRGESVPIRLGRGARGEKQQKKQTHGGLEQRRLQQKKAKMFSRELPGVSKYFRNWYKYLCVFLPKQFTVLLGVLNSFLRCVRPLCHCWCPPFSAGPCSISIHLFPRSATAGVRPFPLAM